MIRRFYAHNFRCFENFELLLDRKASVLLLGKNGVGKSTVGLALEVLQSIGRGINRVSDLVRPRDLTSGRNEIPVRLELEVDLHGEIYAYAIAFELPPGFRELRVLEERLHVGGRPVFTRALAEVRIAPGQTAAEGVFRIDRHLIALPIVQDQSPRDPISVFKKWLGNMVILRPVPNLFRGTTDGDRTDTTTIDARAINVGAWFTDMMAASPETYSLVSAYLSQVMPDFTRVTNQLVGKSTRNLQFHFKNLGQELSLDLEQLSDGEKCFVLYALVIAASAVHHPILCFWDEPDNFLAPDEVGQSIMALRRAFQNTGQLLVTSHNPEAIRRFSEENTFYLKRKNRLEPTTYRTVEAMRSAGEYSGNLVDTLLRGDLGVGVDD